MMASRRYHPLPVAVGLAVLASMAVHLWALLPDQDGSVHVAGVLLTLGGSGLGLVYLGVAHADVPASEERRARLAAWMAGSVVVFAGVGVVTVYLGSAHVGGTELLEVLHVNGGVGLFVGHVLGVLETRGLHRAEQAARETARADALQDERRRAEKLNDLLRHYVRNGVSVIDGYAATIGEQGDYEAAVGIIRERAATMALLVENVHALTVARDAERGPAVLDLSSLLREVVGDREDVRVAVAPAEEAVSVRADDGLVPGLRLLLDAVARVTAAEGALELRCVPDAETVRVCVAGAPGALSAPLRDSVFEPVTAGVGLELYLVAEFLDDVATVETVDSGADSGTVAFAVELARER